MNDTCGRLLLFVRFFVRLFVLLFFPGSVFLCYSSCPEIQSLNQASFKLIEIPLPLPPEVKACATTTWLGCFYRTNSSVY